MLQMIRTQCLGMKDHQVILTHLMTPQTVNKKDKVTKYMIL